MWPGRQFWCGLLLHSEMDSNFSFFGPPPWRLEPNQSRRASFMSWTPLLDSSLLMSCTNHGRMHGCHVLSTEECSTAILDPLLEKKKDPGCPTITCSIGSQHFSHALCDLGASVSVIPKVVYDKLNYHELAPTAMCL